MTIQRKCTETRIMTYLKETLSLLRQDSLLLSLVCMRLIAFLDYVSYGATRAACMATADLRCDLCVWSHEGNSCLQREERISKIGIAQPESQRSSSSPAPLGR